VFVTIDSAQSAVEVIKQVQRRHGRVAAQKMMRVRNCNGDMAIHLVLRAGTITTTTTTAGRYGRTGL
jgi:hypothetical protein